MPEKTIHLDDTHSVRIVFEDDGTPILMTTYHPNEAGETCFGTVDIGPGEWEIKSFEPLEVIPSIVCEYCTSHAVISKGEWKEFPQYTDRWRPRQKNEEHKEEGLFHVVWWMKKKLFGG